jgi:hypothetical protein
MTRNIALLFVCTALSTTLACKKTETLPEVIPVVNTPLTNGVPTDKKQNGYLYSVISAQTYSSGSFGYNVMSVASFNDPETNLMGDFNHYNPNQSFNGTNKGNVDVGTVSLNGNNINKALGSNIVFYFASNNSNPPTNYSATWTTAGNKTFVPLNVTLPRGYPVINTTALNIPTNMYRSIGYTLNFNNNIANYDSLIFVLDNYNGNKIRKIISNNEQSVTFTSQELNQLSNYYLGLNIYTFNYASQTINNKKMVFELSNQLYLNNIQLNN